MSDGVKYPDVVVTLIGEDSNAMSIVGRTVTALRRSGVSVEEIDTFRRDAYASDYDNLLNVVQEWVEVE